MVAFRSGEEPSADSPPGDRQALVLQLQGAGFCQKPKEASSQMSTPAVGPPEGTQASHSWVWRLRDTKQRADPAAQSRHRSVSQQP